MPSDFLSQPDSYSDEILEQVEESQEDPYDLVELMRIRHERRQQDYEMEERNVGVHGPMLVSNRDEIRHYRDVDYEAVAGQDDTDYDSLFNAPLLVNREADKAFDWFRRHRHAVYQDGIRLPVSIGDIAPIGTVAGVANFLATSRIAYNVSRNAIDESEDKLRAWRSGAGLLILEKVAAAVVVTLKKLGVEYSWKELWTGEDKNLLSKLSTWSKLEP